MTVTPEDIKRFEALEEHLHDYLATAMLTIEKAWAASNSEGLPDDVREESRQVLIAQYVYGGVISVGDGVIDAASFTMDEPPISAALKLTGLVAALGVFLRDSVKNGTGADNARVLSALSTLTNHTIESHNLKYDIDQVMGSNDYASDDDDPMTSA
jgi:hypothetical protein